MDVPRRIERLIVGDNNDSDDSESSESEDSDKDVKSQKFKFPGLCNLMNPNFGKDVIFIITHFCLFFNSSITSSILISLTSK